MARTYRAGDSVEDFCRACKMDRMHTVIASDSEGRPLRVVCGYCDSEHNFRGGPRIGTDDRSEPASAPAAARAPRPARDGTRQRRPATRQRTGKGWPSDDTAIGPRRNRHRDAAAPHHPRGERRHTRGSGREMARRNTGAAAFEHAAAGEDLADRDLLPQGRDAAQPPPHARAAAQRRRAAGRSQGQAAGIHHGLLRIPHQLQRAVRRGGRPVQGIGRRIEPVRAA